MKSLTEIEILTKKYNDAKIRLKEEISMTEAEIQAVKRRCMPQIKKLLEKMVDQEIELRTAIEESPEHFIKPRTLIFNGIKIGFQKSKGTLTWESAESVIRLIKKLHPENADVLIRIQETPNKNALAELPAHELKKLGLIITETSDEVVIKSTDSEIEKIINTLLKDVASVDACGIERKI